MPASIALLNAHPLIVDGFELSAAAAARLSRACPALRAADRAFVDADVFRATLAMASSLGKPIGQWPASKTALVAKCLRQLDPEVELREIALAGGSYAELAAPWHALWRVTSAPVDLGFPNMRRGLVCYVQGGRRMEIISEPAAGAAAAATLALRAGLSRHWSGWDVLVCSGRIAAPCRAAVLGMMAPRRQLRSRYRIIDSRHFQLRPDVRPEIAKFNESEATSILGLADTRPATVATRLRALPAGTAYVVTLGARGVIATTPSGEVAWLQVPGVDVANAIGAGDTFTAVLVRGMAARAEWTGTLRMAAAQATLSTTVREEGWITPAGGLLRATAQQVRVQYL